MTRHGWKWSFGLLVIAVVILAVIAAGFFDGNAAQLTGWTWD